MDDTHGNSLPVKRSFRMVKHLPINSPAYDDSKDELHPNFFFVADPAQRTMTCSLTMLPRLSPPPTRVPLPSPWHNTIIIGLSSYTGGGERWDQLAAADLVGSVKGGGPEVISWDRWICWDRSQQYYNICK
ncbi:hypothetical protein JB92DRAFT_2826471 [Gautieria morchelliformis]|nr:hypothetical protein JB92DRAFT_2826471 [Gautieria morchelliformis]